MRLLRQHAIVEITPQCLAVLGAGPLGVDQFLSVVPIEETNLSEIAVRVGARKMATLPDVERRHDVLRI
jgi:hypothetical protein